MTRLRLLKVVVQPVFVLDDGDTLTEKVGNAVTVAATDWRAFGVDAFSDDELAKLADLIDQPDPS